jgi:hypothetical protein
MFSKNIFNGLDSCRYLTKNALNGCYCLLMNLGRFVLHQLCVNNT